MSDRKNALSNNNSTLDAGNSLSEALDITLGNTPSLFNDWVGTTDPDDYYRFTLDRTTEFDLSLTGLSERADVELIDSSGAVLVRADDYRTNEQNINAQLLEGTYYLRVEPSHSEADTNYELSVSATPIIEAGNTFSKALDINLGDTPSLFNDWVGTTDRDDYYRFTLDKTSDFNLSLTGLSERADVELIDNSGAVLVLADDYRTNEQNINVQLLEGSYYIKVIPSHSGANTDYDLSVSATPALNPESPPSTPNTLYVEELRRNRERGFALTGPSPYDGFGRSITTGDVNKDGFTDLIIGADNINSVDPDGDPTVIVNFIEMKWEAENAYVIYGEEGGFLNPVELTSPDGRESSVLKGQVEGLFYTDEAGTATDAGDFNGDGIQDVIVGAPEANTAYHRDAGEAFVLLGSEEKFPAEVELSKLDGQLGFTIKGRKDYAELGFDVSSAGDVNGDRLEDFIVGAPGENKAYVFFGQKEFPAVLGVENLNGKNGFRIEGKEGYTTGYSVDGGKDLNGDGISDLLVHSTNPRETYAVFGSNQFDAVVKIDELNGTNGFTILDNEPVTEVAMVGDLDGNGKYDLAVTGRSATYVIYQPSDGFPEEIDLENPSLQYVQKFEKIGGSIAFGDFNNDGYDDLTIGIPDASIDDRTWIGAVKVLFGGPQGLTDNIHNLKANEGLNIVGEKAFDRFGSVVETGDVNNDGIDDILTVAVDNSTKTGTVFAIYGQPNPIIELNGSNAGIEHTVDFAGDSSVIVDADSIATSLAPTKYDTISGVENFTLKGGHEIGRGNTLDNHITGNDGDNLLEGTVEDDILSGGLGNDTLTGGVGADTFIFSSSYEAGYNSIFDTITDFSAAEGDIIQIDAVAYGISDISELSFDAITESIFLGKNTVVTLEGVTSFDTSKSVVLV